MKFKISSSVVLFGVATIVVVGLIAYVATRPTVPQSYFAFAQCLTDKGAKMYGAWWCSHCQSQKKLFGAAFKNVTYVECSGADGKTVLPVCKDAGITGYPTWEFSDASRASGEQSFANLAAKSGCLAPTP